VRLARNNLFSESRFARAKKKAAQKPRTRVFIAILPNFRTKGVVNASA
jgi:hypothetical protein